MRGRESRLPVEGGGVAFDHVHAEALDNRSQYGHEVAIDLYGQHRSASFSESERERAEPGPDLDHLVARADPADVGDSANSVGINHEVLAQRSPRR